MRWWQSLLAAIGILGGTMGLAALIVLYPVLGIASLGVFMLLVLWVVIDAHFGDE